MNVVFFFFDELRQDALSIYDKTGMIRTENIERIARKGKVFDNCFCTSPLCVPSRSSILTSLYPEETAIYGNEAVFPTFHMTENPTTFVKVLEENRYSTASFGKTHVPEGLDQFQVNNPEGGEMNLGLTKEDKATLDKIIPPGELSFNAASLYPEGKEYYPEKVTENAMEWIKAQNGPFFARISYLQPHSPIILKRGYEDLYKDLPLKNQGKEQLSRFESIFGEICGFSRLSEAERRKALSYYYAMVKWLDDEVGKVLDMLEETGLINNTVLMLSSDHGALRGECGGGLGKHVFNRAAQAVPLIISTPDGRLKGHETGLCSTLDIGTTLLSLLGIQSPGSFQGIDLTKGPREEVYASIGYGEASSRAFPMRDLGKLDGEHGWPRRSAIRKGSFRLDMNTRINGREPTEEERDLFFVDTSKCPAENMNMANWPEYAEEVKEMTARLLRHIAHSKEVPEDYVRLPAGLREKSQQ